MQSNIAVIVQKNPRTIQQHDYFSSREQKSTLKPIDIMVIWNVEIFRFG